MTKERGKKPETALGDPDRGPTPGNDSDPAYNRVFRRLAVIPGLLAVLSAILGFSSIRFNITILSSVYPGYKTIALSAALAWILLGSILAISAARPLRGTAALAAKIILAAIVVIEAVELPLNILGGHSAPEAWMTALGEALVGPASSPISPVASGLIILVAFPLFFLVRDPGQSQDNTRIADIAGILGSVTALAGFTVVLSYLFGNPLLYGTQIIPIAALSALAAFFMGAGLVLAAGPAAVPLRYFSGSTTQARMLRIFVPLSVVIVIIQQIVFFFAPSTSAGHDAILTAGCLVLFAVMTGYAVSRISGRLGSALDRSERELVQKNEDLSAMNEELVAIEEELRQNIEELGKSAEALRESEARLARTQEIARLGSWELDLRNNRLSWSDEVYRIFGFAPQESAATYDAFLAAIHPDDRAAVDAAYTVSVRDGKDGYGIEHRIVQRTTGEIRYVCEKCEHVRDASGTIVRSVGMVQDITGLKQVETELRQRQAEIQAIFENIPAGLVLFSGTAPYTVLVHNRYYQELFAEPFRSRGMAGLNVQEYAPAAGASGVVAVFDEVARTQQPRNFLDFPYNSNPEKESWFNWHMSPIILDGNVVALVSMSVDVTAHHMAGQALRESGVQLHRAMDLLDSITKSSGVMIAAEDTELRYTYFNKAYADEIRKITGKELTPGMSMADLFKHLPTEQENSVKQWKKVLAGESIRQTISFENPGCEPRTFNVLHTPIRDGDGTVIGAGEVSYDVTLQIRAADELRETSQYLDNLITYANAPIIVWDPEYRITRFNQAFERLTGRTAQEVIGQTPDFLFPEKYRSRAMDLIRKTTRGKRWEVVEIPILHKNGEIRTVLWNSAVLTDKNCKTIIATIAQGQDITDRKRAEEAMIHLEARERAQLEELTKVLDAVPAAVWISHDPLALQVTGNRISHEWLNLQDGVNMSKSAPPGERPETFRMFRNGQELRPEEMPVQLSSAGNEVRNYEFDFIYPGGEVRHVLGNATPLLDESGKPRGSVTAFIDITDRRQAEESILSEKEKAEKTLSLLNATLESTTEGIFVVDTTRKITSFNQNFISLWNITGSEIMTGDDGGVWEFLQQRVKDPDQFLSQVLDLYRFPERESFDMVELKDGRIFERHSKPQKLREEIIGRVWSYQDVTDRRRAEEKLIASLQEKETLIREIHHRVKNNLQIISGLLDMTRMRTTDSTTNSILTDMMMKIKTMAQIHTRLYESKQFDRINMGSQIRDQVTDLSSIYGRSGAEIQSEVNVEDVYMPVDQAIPCALVVNEILSNAFKHAFKGRKHGNLGVTVTRESDHIRIVVRDDGVGIPGDVDVHKAASLGLKLVRSLVMQLNGSVSIASDHGTEVTVECPFQPGGK